MKKRMLALLLALCMMLSLIPSVSAAQSGTCGEGLTWSFADGTLTISGSGAMDDYQVEGETPSPAPWYAFRKEIHNLVIGSGVTYIGTQAFSFSGLTTVDLSASSVKAIGREAFSVSALTSIVLPKGLTEIAPGLFMNCFKLSSVVIPDGVTTIGAESFMNCAKLDILTVPASVTSFGNTAFYDGPDVLFFEGSAPANALYCKEHAFIYYPQNNPTWNDEVFDAWSSQIIFRPYTPFTDVPAGAWFKTPVGWAISEGITQGTSASTFSPDLYCTRAQVVTFLWRAAGKPMPNTTENPFSDVKETDWFYNAVLWAVENDITVGIGGGKFGTEDPCTRAQVATFLWRTAYKPAHGITENPFTDLTEDWYVDPVLWAFENNITQGDGAANTFNPNGKCTRAQIVTFLYRYMA